MDFDKYLKQLKHKTEGVRYVRKVRGVDLKWMLVATILVLICSIYGGLFQSPSDYPVRTIFTVEKGETLSEVASNLDEANIIKSPLVFKVLVPLFDGDHGAKAGDYFLHKRENVLAVAYRMAKSAFGLSPVKLFVPEGLNVFQLAETVAKVFPSINPEEFIEVAGPKEGYLFPDTYILPPNVKPKTIVEIMTNNFNTQITALVDEITAFGRPVEDVVTMASIIEEEARLFPTKRIVSGILWKRIEVGMPLQVDASFSYVNGKNTYELTTEDLRDDSPYNTYTNKGLTPTPIASPGLDSILAAVTPVETEYYFYLTDHEGNMRYAATHDEHVANKLRYLR